MKWSVDHTGPFTILEPRNPSIHELYEVGKCRSMISGLTDCERVGRGFAKKCLHILSQPSTEFILFHTLDVCS